MRDFALSARMLPSWLAVGIAGLLLLAACTPPAPTAGPTVAAAKPSVPTVAPSTPATVVPALPATALPATATGRGGTLRVGYFQNPTSLDPAFATSLADRNFYFNIYDTLVGQDQTGKPSPGLATSWTVTPDAKTYTFKLRSDVKFTDGTAFDADAAKYNLDRILDKATASPLAGPIQSIQSVEAIDPQTLKVTLSTPLAPLLGYLSLNQGMMLSPTALKALGKDFSRKPVGTGPFKLAEWVQDDHVTLERNSNYWDAGKPLLDRILFQIIPDSTVRFTSLQAGNLDFVFSPPPQNLPQLRQPGAELQLLEQPSISFYEIRLNNKRPPFDNMALRQALWYAIDPSVTLKNVLFNNGVVVPGPIAPTSWAFDPGFKRPGPDAAMAKQKLADGGKPDGYEFTYDVRNLPPHPQMAEVWAAQAAAVGIKMNLHVEEVSTLLDALFKRDYEASDGIAVHTPDPDFVLYGYYGCGQPTNQTDYCNNDLDALLLQARASTDVAERTKLYQQAQQTMVAEASRIPLIFGNDNFVMTKAVQGVQLYVDGNLRAKDVSLKP
jgi:peptide/nickel transport system substrate-binding protein